MPRDHNRRAWDELARQRQRFTRPAQDRDFRAPLKTLDAMGWLGGNVAKRRVLCLAAGGGKQGPLYAAAGAEVTVVDISPEMLLLDRSVAEERRLQLRTVETSMDDLSMFEPGEFDIVIHPVSTCYLSGIRQVFANVARVCAIGGLYISQHKQPASLQADVQPSARGYELVEPYDRKDPLPPAEDSRLRESGTLEFLHTWESIVGGMCREGFVIEDLVEPRHGDADGVIGSFAHRSRYLPPYVRVKARRMTSRNHQNVKSQLWLP